MVDGDEQHRALWHEIKEQLWPAIDELRRFRVKTLIGLLGFIGLVGIAWGVETSRVSNHVTQDGLHITVAQATETAKQVQKIESTLNENCKKIEALETAVNKQREAADENTEAILDAINRRNGDVP